MVQVVRDEVARDSVLEDPGCFLLVGQVVDEGIGMARIDPVRQIVVIRVDIQSEAEAYAASNIIEKLLKERGLPFIWYHPIPYPSLHTP